MEELEIEKITELNIEESVKIDLGEYDKIEAKALGFDNTSEALRQVIEDSEYSFKLSVKGEVLGVCGIVDTTTTEVPFTAGMPWFVCNKKLSNYSLLVKWLALGLLDESLKKYQYLSNFVLEDNKLSQEFIRRLGFTIVHDPPIKIGGVNFLEYYMKKE